MRHSLHRVLASLTSLCLFLSLSVGRAEAIPPLTAWETKPVEVTLFVQEESHMPLDETRTGELNRLLSHIHLRLRRELSASGDWQSVSLLVDDKACATLTVHTDEMGSRLSLEAEDRTLCYQSQSEDLMERLVGFDSMAVDTLSTLLQGSGSERNAVSGIQADTAQHRISGTAQLAVDDEAWTYTLDISPDLQINDDLLSLTGTIRVTQIHEGHVWRKAVVDVHAACTPGFDWLLPSDAILMDQLTENEIAEAQEAIQLAVTRSLIRRLSLLWPASENAYLNRDLDDWQSIVREAIRPSDWEE